MTRFRIEPGAAHRLDEIYAYTDRAWGEEQAESYIRGMFARFEVIAKRKAVWRQIPVEYGLEGYFCGYEKHFIYWRVLGDGEIAIAAVLHERMHLVGRLKAEFGES